MPDLPARTMPTVEVARSRPRGRPKTRTTALVAIAALLSGAGATRPRPCRAEECRGDTAAARLIEKGEQAFQQSFTVRKTWTSIALFLQALERSPDCYEALWRLARSYAWISELEFDRGGNAALGKKGYDAAFRAIQLDPRRVEGYFWSAVCVGEYGRGMGLWRAFREGIGTKFRRYLDFAMRIDRAYEDGGADRMLGYYYNIIPWPLRDKRKSFEHFRRSLEYSPRHPRTLLFFARVLVEEGRRAEAVEKLEVCASVSPSEGSPLINQKYLWQCRRLLEQIGTGGPRLLVGPAELDAKDVARPGAPRSTRTR
jgi:tetratricopeptide (TPR) repeat protein